MNREILFKAKRLDNGEWVEGYYQKRYDTFGEIEHLIFYSKSAVVWGYVEVNPDTLCQYTGLTDKNGNKIWENDIVGEYSEYWQKWFLGTVSYGYFNCDCCEGVYGWIFDDADIRCYEKYEVKGNIFDNPELLERRSEDDV